MLGDHCVAHHLFVQRSFRLGVGEADLRHPLWIMAVARIMFAGLMVRSERVDGVDHRQRRFYLGHMCRGLLLFAGDQEFFGAPTNGIRGPGRALRKDRTKTFPLADHHGHLDHRVGVPISQVNTPGVLQGDPSFFEAFHRPGDRRSAGDGIHPIHVAVLIGLGNGRKIADAAVASKGRQGLIFWPAIFWVYLVRPLVNLRHSFTTDRTRVARIPSKSVLVVDMRAF